MRECEYSYNGSLLYLVFRYIPVLLVLALLIYRDLMNRYSVRTIPRLIVCKPDGASITTKGRSEIESRLAGAAFNWIESSRPKPKQLVNGFVSGLKIDYS